MDHSLRYTTKLDPATLTPWQRSEAGRRARDMRLNSSKSYNDNYSCAPDLDNDNEEAMFSAVTCESTRPYSSVQKHEVPTSVAGMSVWSRDHEIMKCQLTVGTKRVFGHWIMKT